MTYGPSAAMVRFAVRRKWLNVDPSSNYDLPPAQEKDIEVFSAEELAALYEDPVPGMTDIWRLLTQTCLRIGEFMWLMKEDVIVDDEDRPVALNVCKKVCPYTGKTWSPKHGIERLAPLTAEAAGIVAEAMKSSQTLWLFESPVSKGKQTGMWTYGPLLIRLHARQDAAGIARTGMHRFRHTGATYLANDAAIPIAQLKEFLGHKDIKMTMRYLHPRAEHVQETIARVNFNSLINNTVAASGAATVSNSKVETPKTVNSQSTPGKAACTAGV